MLCEINGLTVTADVPGKRYILQPDDKLGYPWIVLNGKLDKICNYPAVVDFCIKNERCGINNFAESRSWLFKVERFYASMEGCL